MLDAVGFDTEIRIQEQATYFEDYRTGTLGNIVWFGWGGWTLDFDNTYYSMHKTGESYNPGYSNAEVDALLVEQRTTLDQAQRLDIAKQINQILYDEAPDVAMYQNTTLWGVNNRVHNFLIPPDERLWWGGAWVE
jgi:peptide/nickel transport system substrate-binding protein